MICAPCLAAAAGAAPYNWGTEKSDLTSGAEYAKSKAICRQIGNLAPPASDEPTPAQAAALKNCNSEKLYYGGVSKPDYVKARLCAFREVKDGNEDVFRGRTILMQIYANGLGVKRDPDLATAYACELEGAPAESNGRVLHMQYLKIKPEHVDYCDDITSGAAEGFCAARQSAQVTAGRDAELAALIAQLPEAAHAPYAQMKQAFDTFVTAHGYGEVDLSGTARGAMVISARDRLRDQLVRELKSLISGHWPPATAAQAKEADAHLNAAYREAISWAKGKDNLTTIKWEDIRKAQRAWIAYRDTFLRFAQATAPDVGADAILARLAKLRIVQLQELAE